MSVTPLRRGPAPGGASIRAGGALALAQVDAASAERTDSGAGSGPGPGSGGPGMELLRTITYQPAASGKMCEQALGRACGGDPRKKRAQQPPEDAPAAPHHHHHHHGHAGAEVSRIIVDPTTGKRYCRGKVLGKVTATGPGGQGGPRAPPATPSQLPACPQIWICKSASRA